MTKAYPAYKDSGVEWLGEVPEAWQVKRLGMIATGIQTGPFGSQLHTEDYVDGGVPLINPSNIRDGQIVVDEEITVTPDTANRLDVHALQPGDIVMGRRGELGRCAVVPKAQSGFLCGTGSLKIRLDKDAAEPTFISAAIRTTGVREWLSLQSVGSTMENLNTSIVSNIPLAVPPLPEQTAIAVFLDRETAKIDTLVAEQQRLIDLLREKRQAVISHAVTKGLNPNAALKPSGIDWLGDVPEGWEVKRLSLVCGFEQGKAHEPYFDDDGEFICVTARFVSTAGEKFKRCSANLTPAAVGDILMVMSDLPNGRALARAFLVDQPEVYAVNQRVCRITVKPKGDARYFAYQLNRHTTLLSEDDGFNQTHLSNASFTKLQLVVPPDDEQKRIAEHLDSKTGAFDTLTATAETAIALLQERRAALISAAVTGKIDVRHLSPAATEAA